MVMHWTRAHDGVFPNHYADVITKAYIGRPPRAPYDAPLGRRTSMVQYGVAREAGGAVSWMAGSRRLRELAVRELGRYTLRHALDSAKHSLADLIMWMPDELPTAWPWATAWVHLLAMTSGLRYEGGAKMRPTSLGAVMRVRCGHLGVGPSDFTADSAARAMEALRAEWARDAAGQALADRVDAAMRVMATAVSEPAGKREPYHEAVRRARDVLEALRDSSQSIHTGDAWRRLRAAASGALPLPSRAESEATRQLVVVTGHTPPSATGGRDDDRLTHASCKGRGGQGGGAGLDRAVRDGAPVAAAIPPNVERGRHGRCR